LRLRLLVVFPGEGQRAVAVFLEDFPAAAGGDDRQPSLAAVPAGVFGAVVVGPGRLFPTASQHRRVVDGVGLDEEPAGVIETAGFLHLLVAGVPLKQREHGADIVDHLLFDAFDGVGIENHAVVVENVVVSCHGCAILLGAHGDYSPICAASSAVTK
jgi:hypothetical protein